MSYLEIENYQRQLNRLYNSRYVDFPYRVSIETLSLCNAACDFCPYPSLERKGAGMPDALLWKILNEFRDLPPDLPVVFNPSRVNEPFLDRRIFDVLAWTNQNLPHFSFTLFSNATPLNHSNLLRLAAIRNVNVLVLSINDYRADVYEKVMQLSFCRTMDRLAEIHRLKQEGGLYFDVVVSRVGDHSVHDLEFRSWAERNFPLFQIWVTPRADWTGAVHTIVSPVPDIACTQWFALEILANGKEAFCCMDSDGRLASGNAESMHILEIYNQPRRRALRMRQSSRLEASPCNRCPLHA